MPEEPSYSLPQQEYPEQLAHNRPVERRHSVPVATNNAETPAQLKAPPIDYSGDLHMTQSDVDAVLARYETILGDHNTLETTPHRISSSSSKSSIIGKSSNTKLPPHMKPKIPTSIKEKQERLQKNNDNSKSTKQKSKTDTPHNIEHLEVEEITTEVLDSMLSELMENGCENKINERNKEKQRREVSAHSKKSEYKERKLSSSSIKEDLKYPKSFNYQDISENMTKSSQDIYSKVGGSSQICSPQRSPRYEPPNNHSIVQSNPPMRNCRTVDDCSAMELHRSKSYIVSLIDRALSKELGTLTDERQSVSPTQPQHHHNHALTRESDQMDARQAIDMMNKNLDKMDKGLCLEITPALTDSIVSNATAPQHTEVKHGSTCSCNVQDEPLYVKQLKQLRWGHLKHIQREVRRLEDLERFLDSCSSGSFM
ncbi:hypothetical protein ILUMI_13049 [Ignelater luminosus]|uniref:Uncharacterized protein n=1 Tax=Ignelater luminosus TaxID=2038154 RepID=A0A8K0CZ88_IGNLU|nr:hypothetical protein ILUMI_13049 [Ignelater luminosus]